MATVITEVLYLYGVCTALTIAGTSHLQHKMKMKILLVMLLGSFLLHFHVDIVRAEEENCYRGDEYDYDNPCYDGSSDKRRRLDYCREGQRLIQECTENCVFCIEGVTFSDSRTNCLTCKSCRTECPEGQVITQPCTLESDAVCGCPPQPCPTNPPPTTSTCEPCPTCPAVPTETDTPEVSSEPQVPLQFTRNCPSGIEISGDNNESNKSVSWDEPQATAGSKIVHRTFQPGHFFPIGYSDVLYVFANSSGATISCSFYVRIKAAPVRPTEQPVSDPVAERPILIGTGFISGVLITSVVLFAVWCVCCKEKAPFHNCLCPCRERKAGVKDNKGDEECKKLLRRNGGNPGGDADDQPEHNHLRQVRVDGENHRGAAGNLSQADGDCNDKKRQKKKKDKNPGTELETLSKDKKEESDSAKYPGNPSLRKGDQTSRGQQENGSVEDMNQQSSATDKSVGQYVVLPPDFSSSSKNPDGEVPPLINPGAEVDEDDLDWLSDTVVKNPSIFEKRQKLLRKVITDHEMNLVKDQYIDDKADPETKIFKFLKHGWLLKKTRSQFDLVHKLEAFSPSLAKEYVEHINEKELDKQKKINSQ